MALRIKRWAAVATVLSVALLAGLPTGSSSRPLRWARVIVQGSLVADAAHAVRAAGGKVTRRLPLVNGAAALIPRAAVARLRAHHSLLVTPDASIAFNAVQDYTLEPQRIPKNVGSDRLWAKGITGRGVTVALVDTGIYEHDDLDGRIVHCEDLSHEAGTEAECADTFGHGTFMAGLIAGDGGKSHNAYKGTAPQANLVSVKLAGYDGSTDVSHVLAGIQWVVAHRKTYDIRVMNLSLGTDSPQSYALSPLNYAVQKAWKAGIVVVVSAGNGGPDSRTILKPADDPYVVTVGASNDELTPETTDDRVPVFSSRGPTRSDGLAKPDVVAPGTHTISLRSPGSAIDNQFGSTATVSKEYFRGTGTSMSAAVVTGVVAQMLHASPSASPDIVKARLMNTATRIAVTDKYQVGRGLVNAYSAATSTSTQKANQGLLMGLGTGLGSIQADRESFVIDLVTPAGEASLTGEYKAQYDPGTISASNPLGLIPWVSVTYTTTGWDPLTWEATSWVTSNWGASKWRASKWRETEWDASKWRGTDWVNTDWGASKWRGSEWDASKWRATNWQSKWYAAAWD